MNASPNRPHVCPFAARLTAVLLAAGTTLAVVPEASAQAFSGMTLGPDMRALRPVGITSTPQGIVIPYKAIKEQGVQLVETAGIMHAGIHYEMPTPIGPDGLYQDVEIFQYRTAGPGSPVKGIDVGLVKKPSPVAVMWDTRDSMPGTVTELSHGGLPALGSWATSASADAARIGGAIYGNLSGHGVSRHAARWDDGVLSLMAVPAGTRSSEVFDVSPDGNIALGAISEQGMPSEDPKMKPATSTLAKGIIWTSGGILPPRSTVVDGIGVYPGVDALVFTGLLANAAQASSSLHITRPAAAGATKAAICDLATGVFTPIEGDDINFDGNVDGSDWHDSAINAASDNMLVVVGSVTGIESGEQRASIWLQDVAGDYAYYDLARYLTQAGATAHNGWTLNDVTGVSTDGATCSPSALAAESGQNSFCWSFTSRARPSSSSSCRLISSTLLNL